MRSSEKGGDQDGGDGQDGATLPSPGAIILIRHGRPHISRSGWMSPSGWDEWWARYNRTGLDPAAPPTERLKAEIKDAQHILASPLPRAVETAQWLFGDVPLQTDEEFVEAPLPAPPWPEWIKLTPDLWGIFSRLVWLMGYSGPGESHTMALARASRVAGRLEEVSADGGLTVLCAHGWFNRMIRGMLISRRWRCVHDGGNAYWSWRRFEKRADR